MSRDTIKSQLTEVFREVFNDDNIVVENEMTASDVEAWDSISHIDMMCMVEDEFEIKLTTKEIVGLTNIGELISIIESKLA